MFKKRLHQRYEAIRTKGDFKVKIQNNEGVTRQEAKAGLDLNESLSWVTDSPPPRARHAEATRTSLPKGTQNREILHCVKMKINEQKLF